MSLLILRSSVTQGGGGGTFSHGDSVEITGSGFGTGPTASNLTSTIESTNVASNILLPAPFYVPDIATDQYRGYNDPTRGRAIRCPYASGATFDMSIAWDRGSNAPTNSYVYFSWLVKAETLGPNFPAEADDDGGTSVPGGSDDWQWKLARWRYNADDVLDAPSSGDSYIAHWDNSDGSFIETSGGFHYINGVASPYVNNSGTGSAGTGAGGSGRRSGGDDLPTAYTQEWYRCEWFWFMGSGTTGRSFLYVTREGSSRLLVGSVAGNFFSGSQAYRHFYIQNYFGNDASGVGTLFNGSFTAIDDLHCQYGNFRRVELTDSSSLATSTFRHEIQAPQSWADGSVIVTLNTGSGRTGTLYLHVVDTDETTRNDTSLGYKQITVV